MFRKIFFGTQTAGDVGPHLRERLERGAHERDVDDARVDGRLDLDLAATFVIGSR